MRLDKLIDSQISRSRLLTLTVALLLAFNVQAQDEEGEDGPCGEPTDKKVLKLIENSENKKKYDSKERYMFLKKAVEIDEECASCYYELGKRSFRRASSTGSYGSSQKWFLELDAICPEYHSDVYYYLGITYFVEKDYDNALIYFNKFLDFPTGDDSKFSRDWDKKYQDVQEIIPEVEFYAEVMNNPVPFNPIEVSGVSTTDDEYLPMLSPDNQYMFFTRKREYKNKGDILTTIAEELTQGERGASGAEYSKGRKMSAPFNLPKENYGGVTISVDNREMYITVCKDINTAAGPYKNCDIYVSRYVRKQDANTGKYFYEWTELENLGPNVNTEQGWESQPSLSGDGQMLFFSAHREGTRAIDIFVSKRDASGNWGVAKPLDAVNTDGNDKSPFIHSDSQTLYFSSDGRFGVGGYDLFYVKFDGDDFEIPKNIGIPINTEHDEVGLFVSTDGKLAYFSSNRIKGAKGYDVYCFELYKDARPEKILLIKGEMKDENGEALKDATVELTYAETKDVQTITLDSTDGSYAAVVQLRDDEDVIMTVKKEGHAFQSKVISTADIDTSLTVVASMEDMQVEKLEVGKAFRINDVKFAPNSAKLSERAKFILDEFAEFLLENPSVVISIDGHTDNVGDAQANKALSMERAFNVKEYLQRKGIKGSRLKSNGYGEEKPLADNGTNEGRAKNRRTEFKILRK